MKNKLGTISLIFSFSTWIVIPFLINLINGSGVFAELLIIPFYAIILLFFIIIILLAVFSARKGENMAYGILAILIFLFNYLIFALLQNLNR